MGLQDLIVTPIYLIIFLSLAVVLRGYLIDRELRAFFIPALALKFFGAIALGFIYQFYYSGGDTYNYYFWGGSWIWQAFLDSPALAFRILISDASVHDTELFPYVSHMVFYGSGGADFVSRAAGFFSILSWNTYSTIALFFALYVFIGSWWLFQNVSRLFPGIVRTLFIIIFAIPSVVIWSSGVLKDTLVLGSVCLIFGSLISLFDINDSKRFWSLFLLLFGIWVLFEVKLYVLISLVPVLLVYAYVRFQNYFRLWWIKTILMPMLLVMFTIPFVQSLNRLALEDSKYDLDNIANTAQATAWWHTTVSNQVQGSSYSLGDYEFSSTQAILPKILPALNVTLFRPYPWEASSLFILFSSLESMTFLIITLIVILFKKFSTIMKCLRRYPILLAMLIWCVGFAISIGLVTYNFGALVRYKTPYRAINSFNINSEPLTKPFTTWRRIKKLMPSNNLRWLALIVGTVVNSLLELVGLAAIIPIFSAIISENFIHENLVLSWIYGLGFHSREAFIGALCVILVLFYAIRNAISIVIYRAQIRFAWDGYKQLSNKMLNGLFKKGYLFTVNNNSIDLHHKVSTMPLKFAIQVVIPFFQFINELATVIFISLALLIYDSLATLILILVIGPFFAVFYRINRKKVGYYNEKINELEPQINKPIFDVIHGFVDVLIGDAFEFFRQIHERSLENAKIVRTRLVTLQQIPGRLLEFGIILGIVTIFLYSVLVIQDGTQIMTLLSVIGLAAYRIVPAANRLMLNFISMKSHDFVFNELDGLMYYEVQDNADSTDQISFQKSIVLNDIHFRYDDQEKWLFEGLNIEITLGECVGIVGKSGTGKTSMINLILGFLKPTKGSITVDGKLLRDSNMDSWYKLIAYVSQDIFIVEGDFVDNVAFGIPEDQVDLERVMKSIEESKLKELAQTLPNGVNSNIGERGTKLSGGQRQRIGIARALYRQASIFIFDEATANLDRETEEEITEAIFELKKLNKTIIIVSHRETSLTHCDRIIEFGRELTQTRLGKV